MDEESLSDPHLRVPLVPLPGGRQPEELDDQARLRFSRGTSDYVGPSEGLDDREDFLHRRFAPAFSLLSLFRRGHDVESARHNHHYTREERQRLNDVESIDYLPPNSAVYRRWVAQQPWGRMWDRWLMMGGIGVTVGLIGFLLYTFIGIFGAVKYHTVRWLISHTSLFVAWLFNMAYSLALVYLATWTVVSVAPQAAGAGVAEVTAYLNGCSLPKVFNVRTLAVKFISCAAAVGSGLPVGPEGPMIHIGAMIGAALSQGHSTTLGFTTGLFKRFQNPKDKRDFVTAGVAVGVAAAFGAPVGGLLFAYEELASFFSQTLGWQVFFACMLSVLTEDTLRSAQSALTEGHFGLFDGEASTIFFEVQTQLANHVAAVGPAIVIGTLCGLLGMAFTVLNLKVMRLRDATLQGRKWWRIGEPLVLISIFVTLGMLLPLAFPCTPTECYIKQGDTAPYCPEGTSSSIKRIVEETLELYTCSRKSTDTEVPGSDAPNATRSYNELATLMSVTGEDAIKHLLSRGTHWEFNYGSLIVMLVFYFLGAVWAAGSAIASGLFVPMLLIGACVGRLVGLLFVHAAAAKGHGSPGAPPGVFLSPSPWAWIDPGAFALIGAGAFMGGVTRLTISLAVIMMEGMLIARNVLAAASRCEPSLVAGVMPITISLALIMTTVSNDVRMLLPVLVAIMVAKWVADAFTHSLYHAVLEVKCVPILHSEPQTGQSLDLVPVHAVMASPVVTLQELPHWGSEVAFTACKVLAVSLQERIKLNVAREVLRDTRHNGFPVVRNTPHGQVFVGLVVRDHLMVLLRTAMLRGSASSLDVTYEELNRQFVSAAARSLITEQQMAVLQGRSVDGLPAGNHPVFAETIDLGPYINSSAVAVQETFSIERTYTVFRTMGLRHLVVVDRHNHVKGIVTRKDLLGFKLDDAVNKTKVNTATFGSMSRSISVASLQSEQNLLPMASHEVRPIWQDN